MKCDEVVLSMKPGGCGGLEGRIIGQGTDRHGRCTSATIGTYWKDVQNDEFNFYPYI